ncbi:RNA polymerase sigma factor SigM [Micromonospora zhanjiangensis]
MLRAHVTGDRDAFAELFHRHRDRLWAVALRTLADREEAADALQDALLSAHRAAPRFRGDSAVTTWLHRIVVNACLDRIRRRQARPTVPLPDGARATDHGAGTGWGGTEPAAPAPDHDTALVVREALAGLPVEQRAALILVDVQGYPVAEVAEMLGVAEGTVKSRCARGRARLAMQLGDLRPGRQTGSAATATTSDRRTNSAPAARPGRRMDSATAATPARPGAGGPADVRPVTPGNRVSDGDVRSGSAPGGPDSNLEDQ